MIDETRAARIRALVALLNQSQDRLLELERTVGPDDHRSLAEAKKIVDIKKYLRELDFQPPTRRWGRTWIA